MKKYLLIAFYCKSVELTEILIMYWLNEKIGNQLHIQRWERPRTFERTKTSNSLKIYYKYKHKKSIGIPIISTEYGLYEFCKYLKYQRTRFSNFKFTHILFFDKIIFFIIV